MIAQGTDPAWSVNNVLAYAQDGIWVVNPDGGGLRQLDAAAGDTAPRWSADGSRIVFMRGYGGPVCGIPEDDSVAYEVDSAGTRVRRLRTAGDPVWSPDGRLLAFSAFDGISLAARRGPPRRLVAIKPFERPGDGDGVGYDPLCGEEGLLDADWQPRPRR